MALYDIVTNNPAVASDVEQLVNVFNGKHDIGAINLAPSLSAPTSGNFALTAQSGSSLGVGTYNYVVTYVTGQYKSDGITLVQTGETLASGALSITTTSGNTTVRMTIPASLPVSVVAINIYRTAVGGSAYGLVATVKAGNTYYTDSTSDSSRGAQAPPANNTTGTVLKTGKNTLDDGKGNMGLGVTPQYGFHQLGGAHRIQALATPSAPTVTPTGTTGSASYSYYVVAKDQNGNKTNVSSVTTITNGNATLSSTNYNAISWPAVAGAVSYDVLKGNQATALATGVVGTSINDTGQATSAYTTPVRNTTADVFSDGLFFGAVPYAFIASTSGVSIASINTLTNLAVNNASFLSQAGADDLVLGHDSNGDYIYIPHAGSYIIQAQLFLSGLNNGQTFGFLARRYLASGSYGDDQQTMYGWSGLGNNQGSGRSGIPFTFQSGWACDAGDKLYFYAQCTEAPRTINGYNILIQKVG